MFNNCGNLFGAVAVTIFENGRDDNPDVCISWDTERRKGKVLIKYCGGRSRTEVSYNRIPYYFTPENNHTAEIVDTKVINYIFSLPNRAEFTVVEPPKPKEKKAEIKPEEKPIIKKPEKPKKKKGGR